MELWEFEANNFQDLNSFEIQIDVEEVLRQKFKSILENSFELFNFFLLIFQQTSKLIRFTRCSVTCVKETREFVKVCIIKRRTMSEKNAK